MRRFCFGVGSEAFSFLAFGCMASLLGIGCLACDFACSWFLSLVVLALGCQISLARRLARFSFTSQLVVEPLLLLFLASRCFAIVTLRMGMLFMGVFFMVVGLVVLGCWCSILVLSIMVAIVSFGFTLCLSRFLRCVVFLFGVFGVVFGLAGIFNLFS